MIFVTVGSQSGPSENRTVYGCMIGLALNGTSGTRLKVGFRSGVVHPGYGVIIHSFHLLLQIDMDSSGIYVGTLFIGL